MTQTWQMHTRERRKAPVKSGFVYSRFCVLSWSAGWPHGDICDSIDVNLILQWNQKPCVILMWGLSKRPRIHWGDDTTHAHKHSHTPAHAHTHTLKKRNETHVFAWCEGKSLIYTRRRRATQHIENTAHSTHTHGDRYFSWDHSTVDHDTHQTGTSALWTLWHWGITGQMPTEWTMLVPSGLVL